MDKVTASFYARVSSDAQARGNTVASQVAALRERAGRDGAEIGPDGAFVDEGWSGTTLLRPALDRLRDAVAAGEVDRIYVLAPDRLARRYAYQVLLVEEFRRAGVEVVFLNRAIGGSAEDDLLLQVQGMIAEYERARILERSRRGRRHAALSGEVSALSRVPFGYRYISRHAGGGTARVEVAEDEARVVRQVLDWVGVERISLREACRRLQNMNCPTSSGLSRWDATTLCGMLRNPAYAGTAMFGRTRATPPAQTRLRPIRGRPNPPRNACGSSMPVPREDWIAIPVPPIVDMGAFEAAQAQLDENRQRKRDGRRRPGWLLQGLVVCRQCGYAYYGKMARGTVGERRPADYGYYRCTGTDGHRFGGEAPCDNRSVRSDKLEQAVWRQIQAVLDDPQRVAAEHERRAAAARDGDASGDMGTLDRQIARVRRGLDRLIDAYTEDLIDASAFKPRLAGFKERLARLEEERDAAVAAQEMQRSFQLVIGRLEDFADRVRAGLGGLDWHGQRDIIRTLVRRIEIDREQVEVVFRVPGSPPPGGSSPARRRVQEDEPRRNRQHCGESHHPPHRRRPSRGQRRMADTEPLHADRTHGRTHGYQHQAGNRTHFHRSRLKRSRFSYTRISTTLTDTTQKLEAAAAAMAASGGFSVAARHIDAAMQEQDLQLHERFGGELSAEQRAALSHVLGDGRLSCVVGFAGAGKSTMLKTARLAWARQGMRVHGAALSGKAAEGLQNASGIESRTLASLETNWKNGYEPIVQGDILVVDEAGMIGTRQMMRVADKLQGIGAKLVLVGDPGQLQPIEAGTPFGSLIERHGAAMRIMSASGS